MTIEQTRFNSSSLAEGRYDDQTQTLTVTFNNGRSYDLEGVPREEWDGLRQAFSPGRYFNENLKGKY